MPSTLRCMMSPPSDAEQTWPRRPGQRASHRRKLATARPDTRQPLAAKLGIKGGQRFAVVAASSFAATLGPLSPHVEVTAPEDGAIDLVVLFTRERGDLAARFPALRDATATAGSLWIARPKRASGVSTDLTGERRARDRPRRRHG
ncbi:MAG: hypothetical protein U0531_07825 [Dehalococcoidia bacterium]